MNQKTLLIAAAAMFAALMATAALATTSLVQQVFAQTDTTTQEGVEDNDDADQASSTPTKVKNTLPCNISGFGNSCDQEPEAELDASQESDEEFGAAGEGDTDFSIPEDIPSVLPIG